MSEVMRMDNIQFVDAESFQGGGKEVITFRDIVLKHVQNISKLASREWCGGYWNERPMASGTMVTSIKTYVEDSREAYSNAVDYLADMLAPHFDEAMIKDEEENNNAIEKAKESCMYEHNEKKLLDRAKFRAKKVGIKRILFRKLNMFLRRQNYFDSQRIEE